MRRSIAKRIGVGLFVVLLGTRSSSALALDTIEVFAPRAFSVEAHLVYSGLGPDSDGRALDLTQVLGHGLHDRLSVGALLHLHMMDDLTALAAGASLCALVAALDGEHMDLDLGLELGAGGPGFTLFGLRPFAEFNLDSRLDRAGIGLFVQLALPMDWSVAETEEGLHALGLEALVGGTLGLGCGRQLLLAYALSFDALAEDGAWLERPGTVELGFQVMLSPETQVLCTLGLDLPGLDKPISLSLGLGLILSLEPTT